jgi:hypothetical protein
MTTTANYALIRELQKLMTQPYAEQSKQVAQKCDRLKPSEAHELGGVSHMSCSSRSFIKKRMKNKWKASTIRAFEIAHYSPLSKIRSRGSAA